MVKTYEVYNREGKFMMRTDERCRYAPEVEKTMIENGYTIKLGGKKLTMKMIKERNANGHK